MPKTDYAETLLEAMDKIASQRVSSVSFDQTLKCTIVDNTAAGSGKYKVTDGSVTFDAYINDSTYKVDDQVYVLVPDGDFKQQKLIIGKYTVEEDKPYIYESPFDQIVDMTGNLITKHVEKGVLTANLYYDKGIQDLKNKKSSMRESEYKSQLRKIETELGCCIRLWHKDFSTNPQTGYTRLGLQADFSSWLENWNVVDGDYGLRLIIKATNVDSEAENKDPEIYEYYLNVSEMYGNPYKYEAYHTQETAFDITTLDTIVSMELWFYEDSGSFKYNQNGKNHYVPYKDEIFGSLLAPNLFVRDPYICLGYSTADLEDELITLSTTDNLFYEPRMEEDKHLDNKTIHLTWIHLFEDGAGRVDSYDDLDFDEIRWYRYEPGVLAADADSGSHWERLYPTEALKSDSNPAISWNQEEAFWEALYDTEWIIRNNSELIQELSDEDFNEETDEYLYLPTFLKNENITLSNKVKIFNTWLNSYITVNDTNWQIKAIFNQVQPDYNWNTSSNNISTSTHGQTNLKLYVNYAILFLDAGAKGKYKKLFKMILEPDSTQQIEKVKAIVYYDGAVKISNILEFQNKVDVINQKVIDMVGALELRCDDNSSGYYLGYDLGGHLWNAADAQTERTLSLHYYPNGRDAEETAITDLEFLEWIIPKNNTMLSFVDLDTAGVTEDDQYYYVKFNYDKSSIDYKTTVTYKIGRKYSRRYANNTVKARFKQYDNTITGVKEFVFGPKGTAGTRSTFDLMFEDNNVTAILNKAGTAVRVKALLFDIDGFPVADIPANSIEWSWKKLNGMTDEEYADMNAFTMTKDGGDASLIELKLDKEINLWQNKYILQATLKGWENVDLTAYLPIPLKSSDDYSHIEGTIDISYNSNGVPYETDIGDANNFQGYYYLYTSAINNEKHAVDNITWIRYPLEPTDEKEKQAYAYMPTMQEYTPSEEGAKTLYYLRPAGMWVEEARQDVTVCAVDETGNFLWSQPILILQSRYPSQILNDWDGKLKIDEEKNYMLAAKIGAGKKNKHDNTFSGVVMGAWSESSDSGDTGVDASFEPGSTGLWGFYHGEQSFGFVDTGSAFIGRPGTGRITFDGEKGIITSGNWNGRVGVNSSTLQSTNTIIQRGTAGTAIDLQNGHIDAYNFELTSKSIYLNSNPESEEYADDYYMFIGEGASERDVKLPHLYFSSKNVFDLYATNFRLMNDGNLKIYLNSNPSTTSYDYYFFLANADQSSKLYLDNQNKLYIQSTNFELNAYTNNKGIYLNSSPEDGQYYFRVGDTSDEDALKHSELSFNENGELYLKVLNFNLTAGSGNNIITINSNGEVPFKVGSKFQIDWDGTITAKDGIFEGEIYAQQLKFYNIKITGINSNTGLPTWEVLTDEDFGNQEHTLKNANIRIAPIPYRGSYEYTFGNTDLPLIGMEFNIPEHGSFGAGVGSTVENSSIANTKAIRLTSDNRLNEFICSSSGCRMTSREDTSLTNNNNGSSFLTTPTGFQILFNRNENGKERNQIFLQGTYATPVTVSDENIKSYRLELRCQGYGIGVLDPKTIENGRYKYYYYGGSTYGLVYRIFATDGSGTITYYTKENNTGDWYYKTTQGGAWIKCNPQPTAEQITSIETWGNAYFNNEAYDRALQVYESEYAEASKDEYARLYVERGQLYLGTTKRLSDGSWATPWEAYNKWYYENYKDKTGYEEHKNKAQAQWNKDVLGEEAPHGHKNCYGLFIGGANYVTESSEAVQWTEGMVGLCSKSDSDLYLTGKNVYIQGATYINKQYYYSDRNLKNNINYSLVDYDLFFDELKPCSFMFNNEDEGTHFGFIAQDVEYSLNRYQINSSSIATLNSKGIYGLDYNNFIALNTSQIQKLKYRVAQLEQELQELKEKIK